MAVRWMSVSVGASGAAVGGVGHPCTKGVVHLGESRGPPCGYRSNGIGALGAMRPTRPRRWTGHRRCSHCEATTEARAIQRGRRSSSSAAPRRGPSASRFGQEGVIFGVTYRAWAPYSRPCAASSPCSARLGPAAARPSATGRPIRDANSPFPGGARWEQDRSHTCAAVPGTRDTAAGRSHPVERATPSRPAGLRTLVVVQ